MNDVVSSSDNLDLNDITDNEIKEDERPIKSNPTMDVIFPLNESSTPVIHSPYSIRYFTDSTKPGPTAQ